MFKIRGFAIVASLAVLTSGCLRTETTHTLYLGPAGSLTWVASESNVHSDEADAGKRAAEDQSYIGAVLLGSHPVALGLEALGPDTHVRTTVVRDERPFLVSTEARFAHADRALERLFVENGLPARVTMAQEDGRTTLRMRFDFAQPMVDRDTAAAALLQDIEHFVWVLPEGTFSAGGGFEVLDRAQATLSKGAFDAIGEAMTARRPIELTLAWSQESAEPARSGSDLR